jgi:DNA adenine methylase
MNAKPSGPVRWFGGKGHMLAKLMRHVPAGGRPYCEPFAGAASLLFAREPAPVEVLNDLDGDLINLFRCLQDKETFAELQHRLTYTLYSRAEFMRALDILRSNTKDPVLRAWAFFVAQNQSVGGIHHSKLGFGDWGRAFSSTRNMTATTSTWTSRLLHLHDWHLRLLRVQIDCRDALDCIRYWDNDEAVFYVDPPYHPETRTDNGQNIYANEPDHDFHARLVETLLARHGAVVMSCYDHAVYAPFAAAGWQKATYLTACHAAGRTRGSGLRGTGTAMAKAPRVECVWSNPKAVRMIERQAGFGFGSLFDAADDAETEESE